MTLSLTKGCMLSCNLLQPEAYRVLKKGKQASHYYAKTPLRASLTYARQYRLVLNIKQLTI